MNWTKIFLLYVCIILYNVLLNFTRWCSMKKHYQRYKRYIERADNYKEIVAAKSEVLDLFAHAGIEDNYIPFTQSTGFGQVASGTTSVFLNFAARDARIFTTYTAWYLEAIGTYERRIFDSINPLIWIKTIVFLPSRVVKYLGFSAEAVATKILQLIWWIVTPLALVFRDKIAEYLRLLFQ